jgi:type II secretory pathway component PulF
VSLSLREKQRLYHSLAQLIRNGVPFPSALDKLASTTRGSARRLVDSVRRALANGRTVGEAFAAQQPAVTPLEASVLSAVEKSGQLDHGLRELSDYFGALSQARAMVIKRLTYPIFLLHFGILVLGAPALVLKGGSAFIHEVGTAFVFIYAAVAIVAMLTHVLRDAGASSAVMDRVLRALPLLGKVRRSFALSRFCTVYGLQLDAGVNIIDSLIAAGRASRSGSVRSAVDSALPEVRAGAQVGPLLAGTGAFPAELMQSLIVGEETGRLDEELKRMAADLRQEALGTLETLADWLPKLLYVGIVLYLAWKIVGVIQADIAPMYRNALGE